MSKSDLSNFAILVTMLLSMLLGGFYLASLSDSVTNDRIIPIKIISDDEDNIILVGETSNTNFPMINSDEDKIGGEDDIFIVKFDKDGQIVFSTFYGGSGWETLEDVTIDSEGSIIITGNTPSNNLKTTENAFKKKKTGYDSDLFLAKFSSNGNLLYSSYIGGTWNEYTSSVSIDSQDEIVLLGRSASDDIFTDFDNTLVKEKQEWDLFVMYLSKHGDVVGITFITNNHDQGGHYNTFTPIDLAIDSQDGIVVLYKSDGVTEINQGESTEFSSTNDERVHITKYTSSLIKVWEDSYISRNRGELKEMAIDSYDNINLVGVTYNQGFFEENPIEQAVEGQILIAQFNGNGSLNWERNIGGSDYDNGISISLDSQNNLIIAGTSASDNFQFTIIFKENLPVKPLEMNTTT